MWIDATDRDVATKSFQHTSAWFSNRWNSLFNAVLPDVRLPITISQMSFSDRWYLTTLFRNKFSTPPIELVSILGEWKRKFPQLDQFEPLFNVIFYEVERKTLFYLASTAFTLYLFGASISFYSFVNLLYLALFLFIVSLRTIMFYVTTLAYSIFNWQYATYHLEHDPHLIFGQNAPNPLPVMQLFPFQPVKEDDVENQLPTLVLYQHYQQESSKKSFFSVKVPLFLLYYCTISFGTVFFSPFVCRAIYETFPILYSLLLTVITEIKRYNGKRNEGKEEKREEREFQFVARKEFVERLPVLLEKESKTQIKQIIVLLWYYVAPRLAFGYILDCIFLSYFINVKDAPAYVFSVAAFECVCSLRELSHRII